MEKVGDSFVSFCLRSRNLLLFFKKRKFIFTVRIYICSFVYIFFLFFFRIRERVFVLDAMSAMLKFNVT